MRIFLACLGLLELACSGVDFLAVSQGANALFLLPAAIFLVFGLFLIGVAVRA